MSAGRGPPPALIQRSQSSRGASQHSALFYLFQEVSKLASPIQGALTLTLGADSPCRRVRDASPPGSLRAEPEEARCLESSDHSRSPQGAPRGWTSATEPGPVRQPSPAGHSPWKVLSLINLQCQRLLHHSDAEESDCDSLAIDRPPRAAAKLSDQEVALGPPSSHFAFGPMFLQGERKESPPCVSTGAATIRTAAGSTPQPSCAKESKVSSIQSPSAGKRETAAHLTEKKEGECSRTRPSEQNGDAAQRLPGPNIPGITEPISEELPNNHLARGSNIEGVCFRRKPESLDHNANLCLPSEAIREPRSPSTAHQRTGTEEGQPPEGLAGSPQGGAGSKPPRKQPRPSRSVDIHDPDLQGVMFRMDPELDDSADQCRLLITSEFR